MNTRSTNGARRKRTRIEDPPAPEVIEADERTRREAELYAELGPELTDVLLGNGERGLGRESKLTPEMMGRIEASCKLMGSVREVAAACGVDKATIVRWRQRYPELRVLMDHWASSGRELLVRKLWKAVAEDNFPAIKYMLDRRHPDYAPLLTAQIGRAGEEVEEDDALPEYPYLATF